MTSLTRPILVALSALALSALAMRFDGFAFVAYAAVPCGLVMLSDDQRRAVAQRIREALRDAGLSMTEAAAIMNFHSPADLNHVLDDGDRKLDVWRLEMLPNEFHSHYALLELRDRGLPTKIAHAMKVLPALDVLRRSA